MARENYFRVTFMIERGLLVFPSILCSSLHLSSSLFRRFSGHQMKQLAKVTQYRQRRLPTKVKNISHGAHGMQIFVKL